MLSQTDQSDTFHLRIQNLADERNSVRKKEILVRWSITPDHGLSWEYVQHEFFERPTLESEWELTEKYPLPLKGGLAELIETILQQEFWEEFTAPQEKTQLKVDRRRLLQILVGWRVNRMARPKSIQEAVDGLKDRAGGFNELARLCQSNHASLQLASAGVRGLSGRVLSKLAAVADRFMEWHIAELLRSHALVARLSVSRRGGHR